MRPRVLIFAGHSGCGKTFIAKELLKKYSLNYFYLDKDTFFNDLSGEMMSVIKNDRYDRDSIEYKKMCRDHEYNGLINSAIENAELGNNSIICSPFGKEFKDINEFINLKNKIESKAILKTIWFHCSNNFAYEQILKRKNIYDQYKINNWEKYIEGRFLPEKNIFKETLFINTEDHINDICEKIVSFL